MLKRVNPSSKIKPCNKVITERSKQMNIFKQIEKTKMYFVRNDKDSLSVGEYCLMNDHYTNSLDQIYAAYLLGYSRGKKRGVADAIAKR